MTNRKSYEPQEKVMFKGFEHTFKSFEYTFKAFEYTFKGYEQRLR